MMHSKIFILVEIMMEPTLYFAQELDEAVQVQFSIHVSKF